MKKMSRKAGIVAAGAAASASSLGASLVGLALPALAANPPTPACSATVTDTAMNATLATWDAAAVKSYEATTTYKALVAKTAAAYAYYLKHKTAANLAAYNKAKATQAAALAAFEKANYIYSYSGVYTPAAVTVPSGVLDANGNPYLGNWHWGVYTTRIMIQNGVMISDCTYVNEAAAGNDLGQLATAADKATSASVYQGASVGMNQPIPGQLPILWYASLTKPANTAAGIEANVHACATQSYLVNTTACPKGGLTDPTTGMTNATYTVNGFTGSVTAALTAAKTAKHIG